MKWIMAGVLLISSAAAAFSQDTVSTHRDSVKTLNTVKVTATRSDAAEAKPLQALTLPVSASITARKVEQTVNYVDPEDAVKYLPSVFLRKRNNGDTQAVMGTRVWGVSSSARSLIFADGVPLSALIANNNNIGAPRWGLISPNEIERIDMMYGPFSAAYSGNSMGAVMEISTRMPSGLTGSVSQTQAAQHFSLYGTDNTYWTTQTSADVGNRIGRFSVLASGNYQDSHSQPLLYVTSGSFPSGTTGGFGDQNKLGATANVLGATGLLHTDMLNGRVKLAYDFTPTVRAAYTFGAWRNDATSAVDSYIATSNQPTFAGQAGFATGFYKLYQLHTSHSLSIRSNNRSDWDYELVGATYRINNDQQRSPSTAAASDTTYGTGGRVAVLDATHWGSVDAKGAWHRGGGLATHTLTFGAHYDRYVLSNPTYGTAEWRAGDFTGVASEGDGKTRTQALWLQDAWQLTDVFRLTVGGRYEDFRASDGFNANGNTTVTQPVVSFTRFSPKAVALWTPTLDWTLSASVGKAYRFATAAELYQLVTTGATFTAPDPNLRPDNVLAAELRAQRQIGRGMVQASLFQDDVHDAIISQFLPLVAGSSTLYSAISNVDHVRARGVELVASGSDLLLHGLDLSASGTLLDAKVLALSGRANASAPAGSAVGAQLPNIPKWRANFMSTYRATPKLALTFAGRYSSLLYTTLDDADVHPNTYQGFGEWFVADAHAAYRFDSHWSATLGADNLFDRKYFLFHPFPQRTFVASAKYGF